MEMPDALRAVCEGRNLTPTEMTSVMQNLMTGKATPAQIGGFLVGLHMKGETVDELTAAVSVMRSLSAKVEVHCQPLVDTCGTGGDGAQTFNISTASAFVAACAGARVAKHGNRSVSSQCGSADLLEAAGVNLELNPAQVALCIENIGVGFLFAPKHHSATKHTLGPRREMGVRTLFNLLGPLTNPAGALHQVIGVYHARWLKPFAQVLAKLGSHHVMVVHAGGGLDEISLDEISIGSPTQVAELKNGQITEYRLNPEQFGLRTQNTQALCVRGVAESLACVTAVLQGETGPASDVVALNAGAAIYVCGIEPDLVAGVTRATTILASGHAWEKLQQLVRFTRNLTP